MTALPAEHGAPVRSLFAAVDIGSGPQVVSALPAEVDLLLYAGDDFTMAVEVFGPDGEPFDLAGAEPKSQIRETHDGELAGAFTWFVDGSVIYLDLHNEVSAALPERCVWDVQITQNDRVTTLASGNVTVSPQVTR